MVITESADGLKVGAIPPRWRSAGDPPTAAITDCTYGRASRPALKNPWAFRRAFARSAIPPGKAFTFWGCLPIAPVVRTPSCRTGRHLLRFRTLIQRVRKPLLPNGAALVCADSRCASSERHRTANVKQYARKAVPFTANRSIARWEIEKCAAATPNVLPICA